MSEVRDESMMTPREIVANPDVRRVYLGETFNL